MAAELAARADRAAAEQAAADQLAAETAALKVAADKAAADASRAIDGTPAATTTPAATVAVTAPRVVSWAPSVAMSADDVRKRLAVWGRAVLDNSTGHNVAELIGAVGSIPAGELGVLLGALESNGGLKAIPQHSTVCGQVRAFMSSIGATPVCPVDCPLAKGTPAARAPSSSTVTRTTGTPAGGASTGRSLGNVEYHGPNAADPILDITCARAAELAARDFATATSCQAAHSAKQRGTQVNAREALRKDIANGRVPAGTFGMSIVKEAGPESEDAPAAAPSTPVAPHVPTAPTADAPQGSNA